MGSRAGALLLALLALAPGAAATWDQFRGASTHSPVAALADGPLDVLGVLDILPGDERLPSDGSAAFERADGTLVSVAPVCEIVVWTPDEGVLDRRPLDECGFGRILGLDAARDALIMCTETTTGPLVRAFNMTTREEVWAVSAAAFGAVGGTWACEAGAYDAATDEWFFAAGLFGGPRGLGAVVGAIDAQAGALKWWTPINAPAMLGVVAGSPAASAAQGYSPRGLTLTDTGVVVTLYTVGCTGCALSGRVEEGAVAWLTREGDLGGIFAPASDRGTRGDLSATPTVSDDAASRGPIATLVLGGEVALVNPESGIVQRADLEGLEPSTNYLFWRAPVWSDTEIVYPQLFGLAAYSPTLKPLWAWTGGSPQYTADILPTSHASLLVAQGHEEDSARVVELDLRTGAELGVWTMPFKPADAGGNDVDWDAGFVALGEGEVLLIDPLGRVIRMGALSEDLRPEVTPSTLYPAVSEAMRIELALPDVAAWRVSWGDGRVDELPGREALAEHTWGTPGDRVVRVTGTRADGTTASREITVRVGDAPPPELTALQRAFSPEYQNWTFFVLGTLITVVGLAFTVGKHRRRFAKLERELAAVEEIRMLSISDPRGAVLALKSYRERLPDDLARRRIDDSQYQVLDIRSARLLKVLRTRMFAPFDARLSMRYHRLLDAAFEDAILQPSERMALVAALETEDALREDERGAILAILTDFTSARGDVAAGALLNNA